MSRPKRALIGSVLISIIGIVLNSTFLHSQWLGSFLVVYIFALSSVFFGIYFFPTTQLREQIGLGFLSILALLMTIGTLTYYGYQINTIVSIALFILLSAGTAYLIAKTPHIPFTLPKLSKPPFSQITTIVLQLILLGFLFTHRSGDVLVSPWHALPPVFFLIYAASLGFLWHSVQQKTNDNAKYALTVIQCLITFGVAAIVYVHGYGFDGFIHRVTEQWILEHGFILPRAPYYIGQYSLIVFLSHLTRIPIFYLDVYFLPLLAAFLLPLIIPLALKNAWNMPAERAHLLFWLFPFLYFLSPHQTTPHNLVSLLFLIGIFVGFLAIKNKMYFPLLLLISFASLATHPLLGVPLFLFSLTLFIANNITSRKHFYTISIAYALAIIFFPTIMFAANNYLGGFGFSHLTNPFTSINKFLELLALPYWYAKTSPLVFELLYFWQRCITPLVLVLGVIGFCIQKNKPRAYYLYLISFASFIISAWLLRSWIVFPNVAGPEQGNYPMRLLWTCPLFLLPWAMYAVSVGINKAAACISHYSPKKKSALIILTISVGALLMMLSFYFSYPQRNIKARFPGYNVTTADFNAVTWIHNENNEPDYIVLANPLVSVAALTKYSFLKHYQTAQGELFYYAIPSGGPLYNFYSNMLYEGQKKEFMVDAMNLAGANKSYFVINKYWGNSDNIIEGAKKTADRWEVIDGGEVWVFEYRK